MTSFAKTSGRFTSFIIYTCLSLLVLWAGFKIINYSIRLNYYTNYLLQWEIALTRLFAKNIKPPDFTNNNHIEYMENIVKLLKKNSIEIPLSNTTRPYLYKIFEKGSSQPQEIFLLCLEKKIILYGLSKTTLDMLDKTIDGTIDNKDGDFKVKLLKSNKNYAGIWKL